MRNCHIASLLREIAGFVGLWK
uniref:Uncharacterized protein n=1 Tax=Anguilla anguilla TaxID=7936 RepID=A0A0E9VFG9_ANGAN